MDSEIIKRLDNIEKLISNISQTEDINANVKIIEEEKDRCCICLEDLDENINYVALECGHKLNFTCFIQLMNNNNSFGNPICPLCRGEIQVRPQRIGGGRFSINDENHSDSEGDDEDTIFGVQLQRIVLERMEMERQTERRFGELRAIILNVPVSIAGDYYLNDERMYCIDWIIYLLSPNILYDMEAIISLIDSDERISYTVNAVRSAVSRLVNIEKIVKTREGRRFIYRLS